MPLPDLTSYADEIRKYSADASATISAVSKAMKAMPAGSKRHRKDPTERRNAYLTFQNEAWVVFVHTGSMQVLADLTRKPLLFGGIRLSTARRLEVLRRPADVLPPFLAALNVVRLVGNPEPRAAAEELTAIIGALTGTIPTSGNARVRKRQTADFETLQARFGEANKDFTLLARRDLGYAPALRPWWRFWGPRHEEEWPGGWPGPEVSAQDKDRRAE